jgi:hypothetical protein
MIAAALLAVAVAFPPFNVGPVSHDPEAVHITEYAATRAEGRALCSDDLSRYPKGAADCRVEPDTSGPDINQPGWALQFGPGWASSDPDDWTTS